MKKSLARAIAGVLSVALVLSIATACRSSGASGSSSQSAGTVSSGGNKTINIGITNDPGNLNPLESQNQTSVNITKIMFIPLMEKDDQLKFVPRLAESVTTTDNVNFTVKLNNKVKWSDGQNVTADDVIFTINTVTNPKVGSRAASTLSYLQGTESSGLLPAGAASVSGVKKVDDYTLTFTTKQPITLDIFNENISESLRTVPKHILQNEDPATIFKSSFIQKPTVGDGAFLFKEYVAGQYVSLTANKEYFLGAPKLSELNIKILTGTQITAQLQSGEIDMNWPLSGNIPAEDYKRVKSFQNVRTIEGIPSNVQVLFINNKAVDNVKARQAIDLAIDRPSILKNVLGGEADIYKTPLTSKDKYWDSAVAKAQYNPTKAKQLLKESGWNAAKPLVLSVPTGNSTREKIGTIVAEELKTVGFNVTIQKNDLPTTLASVQKRNYDLSIIGMPDVPLDIVHYLKVYASTESTWTNYSNPRADELVKTIETSTDETALKNAYYELQQIIANDVPVTAIWADHALKAVNKRVITGEPKEYGFFVNVEKWDVK